MIITGRQWLSDLAEVWGEVLLCLVVQDTKDLFCCVYRTWCLCPVATVSLCLLSGKYRHACRLLHLFGSLEIDVDILNEVDKLVQLLESPIFAS